MLPIQSVDTARLARAATLQVRPLGNAEYEVYGGENSHEVTFLHASGCPDPALTIWCDCEDFRIGRGARACKHVLAVAITQATDEERAEVAALLSI